MAVERDPASYVVFDMGNSGLRDLILGQPFGREDLITHALQQPSASSYGMLVQKAKYQKVSMRNSAVFEFNGSPYIVGDAATHGGQVNRMTGGNYSGWFLGITSSFVNSCA